MPIVKNKKKKQTIKTKKNTYTKSLDAYIV